MHRGEKVYVATTVGKDCVLGAAMCTAADAAALTQGYGVFAEESRNLAPDYQPETVNTDGWGATRLVTSHFSQGVGFWIIPPAEYIQLTAEWSLSRKHDP